MQLRGATRARAVDNLLLNAIQNAPAGGRVVVGARVVDDRLSLAVADTGPGVAAEVRDHLFEPFVSGRPDGTGLGLSIVREIAEAHGGRVCLRTTDVGATFEIELPWQPCSS